MDMSTSMMDMSVSFGTLIGLGFGLGLGLGLRFRVRVRVRVRVSTSPGDPDGYERVFRAAEP